MDVLQNLVKNLHFLIIILEFHFRHYSSSTVVEALCIISPGKSLQSYCCYFNSSIFVHKGQTHVTTKPYKKYNGILTLTEVFDLVWSLALLQLDLY